jgi:hypothetical protein
VAESGEVLSQSNIPEGRIQWGTPNNRLKDLSILLKKRAICSRIDQQSIFE